MRILIAGSTGLVGASLVPFLRHEAHSVFKLVRKEGKLEEDEIPWHPNQGVLHVESLAGFEAVINLAGANIVTTPWNEKGKKEIHDSRVKSSQLLAQKMVEVENGPKILINASAVGYYGNRGEEILTEESSPGTGFLADVCKDWENATFSENPAAIRIVNLRFGLILSKEGGALKAMLTPFKLGLGGVMGSGKQYMSWIAIDDLLQIILFVLKNEKLQGPLNIVSPKPVTNEEFTKALGKKLNRPTFFSMPEFMLNMIFGKEKANEFFLTSERVLPKKLQQAGYEFLYPELESAFDHLLQKV